MRSWLYDAAQTKPRVGGRYVARSLSRWDLGPGSWMAYLYLGSVGTEKRMRADLIPFQSKYRRYGEDSVSKLAVIKAN